MTVLYLHSMCQLTHALEAPFRLLRSTVRTVCNVEYSNCRVTMPVVNNEKGFKAAKKKTNLIYQLL